MLTARATPRSVPAVPHLPVPVGQRHPAGEGVHRLPAPDGLEVLAVAGADGVILAAVATPAGVADRELAAHLVAWARTRAPDPPPGLQLLP